VFGAPISAEALVEPSTDKKVAPVSGVVVLDLLSPPDR
jgi:hypothetical protein